MKTAVFIVCLIGMACASRSSSSESHSNSISDSLQDSSSSSEERFGTAPTVNTATAQSIITEDFPRGDSPRRRRAVRMDTNSIESHSTSISDSLPDSSSSSEERSTVPTPDGTTLVQARGDSRRRRALIQVGISSHHSEESVTTESTSHQSHPTESSEEDSHEQSTKNILQGILSATTVDPDTSEESSEERTTVFQP